MDEIFLPITNTILPLINDNYQISNYGRVFNLSTNKFVGSFRTKYNRYKSTFKTINNSLLYDIDHAILEYCIFNNMPYDNLLKIVFKDNNPHNLKLDNLLNLQEIISISNETTVINQTISSASYHIKNKQCLYYNIDEKWINISDKEVFNILPIYMISNYGRVYNKYLHSLLYPQISDNGYVNYIVKLNNQKYYNMSTHRTEMKCFCPIDNWDAFEVDHINNNSLDNRLENLRWVTPEYNTHLRFINNQSHTILTDQQVIAICEAFKSGMGPLEISFYVLHTPYTGNVHSKLMSIYRKKTYKHITQNYDFK